MEETWGQLTDVVHTEVPGGGGRQTACEEQGTPLQGDPAVRFTHLKVRQ